MLLTIAVEADLGSKHGNLSDDHQPRTPDGASQDPLDMQQLCARLDLDFQAPVQMRTRTTRSSLEITTSSLKTRSNLKTRVKNGIAMSQFSPILVPSKPGRLEPHDTYGRRETLLEPTSTIWTCSDCIWQEWSILEDKVPTTCNLLYPWRADGTSSRDFCSVRATNVPRVRAPAIPADG
jgi:hypothetical protein